MKQAPFCADLSSFEAFTLSQKQKDAVISTSVFSFLPERQISVYGTERFQRHVQDAIRKNKILLFSVQEILKKK